jgi:hypothetical protein
LARAADQFRQSDVTRWGIVALVAAAVAILTGSISGLVPDNVLAGLHASRLQGANINQMRTEISNIESEQARLRDTNTQLSSRFGMAEQNAGAVTRRVGALEISVPKLLEAIPPGADVDRSVTTGGIGTPTTPAGKTVTFDADGGSVSVTQKPLPADVVPSTTGVTVQPMPAMPSQALPVATANATAFGVALGEPVAAAAAKSQWLTLSSKVGTLLLGLAPLLAHDPGTSGTRLVAGPINTLAQAQSLCGNFDRVGISCTPLPFVGSPLPAGTGQ